MLAEQARKLENDFERAALDPGLPLLAKRRDLGRLLTAMFNEAIADLQEGVQHAHTRGDFVLDFFARNDLAPTLLDQAFGSENTNSDQLMAMARERMDELEALMPAVVVCWQR